MDIEIEWSAKEGLKVKANNVKRGQIADAVKAVYGTISSFKAQTKSGSRSEKDNVVDTIMKKTKM